MSEGDEGLFTLHDYFETPRDFVRELDLAIEQYQRYTDGYEKKYYAGIVCDAAIRLRDHQKTIGA